MNTTLFNPKNAVLPFTLFSLFSLSTASAALVDAGNGLINDTDLNITWTQDAFLFKTQADQYPGGGSAFVDSVINSVNGVIVDGTNHTLSANDFDLTTGDLNWWAAKAFIGYLNATTYGGYNDWRLPNTVHPDASCDGNGALAFGYQCSSELGHLFWKELGGARNELISAHHNANYDLFTNLQNYSYWSGTTVPGNDNYAWFFFTDDGWQIRYAKSTIGPTTAVSAWAVRDGQVPTVPVPSALWMFGSAIACLVGVSGRKTVNRLFRFG